MSKGKSRRWFYKNDETPGVSTCGAYTHFSRSYVNPSQDFDRWSIARKSGRSGSTQVKGLAVILKPSILEGEMVNKSGV